MNPAEFSAVYQERMTADFPADELRPLSSMKDLHAQGNYLVYGCYDEQGLAAYAALVLREGAALLDYYAVDASRRGQGVGQKCLSLLQKEPLGADFLLLEVESVESAEENPLAMLDGMRISASFTGMDFIKITFAEDPVNTLFATVGDAIGTQSNELAARSLLVMASEASGREIDEAAVDAVTQSLKSLEEAKGEEAVDGAIENVVSTLKTQFDPDGSDESWNDEELRAQLRDMYDSTVQHNDGNRLHGQQRIEGQPAREHHHVL